MAFAARNLSVLGNPGFFAGADDMLAAGDMIMVSATEGARLMCLVPDGGGVRATQLS